MSLDLNVYFTGSVKLSEFARLTEANLNLCLNIDFIPQIYYQILQRGVVSNDVPEILNEFTQGTLLVKLRGFRENLGIFLVDLRQYEDLYRHFKQDFEMVFSVGSMRTELEYVLAACSATTLAQITKQRVYDPALAWNYDLNTDPHVFIERIRVRNKPKSFSDAVNQVYKKFPMSKA